MRVHQALRFELDPSDRMRSALGSHAGAARFAYNWGLALVREHLAARRAMVALALRQGASASEAKAWAVEAVPVPWNLYALRREWNATKADVAPWWAENSKEAYSSGLDALARALQAFRDSRSGKREGPRVGFPRFRKRSSRRSFRYTTGAFGVLDARHVRLPRIGVIRTKEATTALLSRVEAGTARVLSVTVSERAGRWYVSFGVETERAGPGPSQPDEVVGVDVGVRALAVLSTGERVPNPKPLGRYQRRMRRLQGELTHRRGPAPGRRPSTRWKASKKRLNRCHAKVANARCDSLHKLTTRLATAHGTIVVEDLSVKGMTAPGSGRRRQGKAGLNRAVLDAAPAELRRQLAYKTAWYGSTLVVADRWYPSSKTCSACQTAKAKLPLAERTFRCGHCGLVIDRDQNAAANLAALVEKATGTASGAGTSQRTPLANAQGEEKSMASARCSSTNCEDGTSPAGPDKTVTAEQSTAA